MNRTTKALARVGTLAIIAGSALSAPFAIGVAHAATITFTVTGPTAGTTAGSATTAANASTKTADAARQVSVAVAGLTGTAETVTVIGSSAYFPTGGFPAAFTPSNNNQTLTCATACGASVTVKVDDSVPELASLGASDSSNVAQSTPVKFNGINYTVSAQECPTTDIDTTTNCVTQGQVGTAIPVTVHYPAGQSGATDTDGAFRQLVVTVYGPTGGGQPVIVTANPATPNTVTCTTDATGSCNLVVVDTNPVDTDNTSVTGHKGHDTITAAIRNTSAIPYPAIGTAPAAVAYACGNAAGTAAVLPAITSAGYCPNAALNITSGSVALTRLDLVSAQLIGPSAQDSNAKNAEPGDSVQLIYTATGGCTPTTFVTCTGQTLAGLSIPLTIDHGFFTPNCEASQSDDPSKLLLNTYGNCSFSTAPAAGGQVGNLTSSGTTKTVVTNTAGQFVVTIGIGRDSAFDAAGTVVANVSSTSAATTTAAAITVGTTIPGDTRTAAAPNCTTTGADNVVAPTTTKKTGTDGGDCSVGIQWVTNEQPLNGGTAKITVLPALALPNNDSIDTENNYGAPNVTDTGTSNVPDTARVVFEVSATDQFGNLVSYTLGSAPVKLTKTGPGYVYNCGSSSAVDACGGPVRVAVGAAQADGTYTETGNLAGTYTNLPVGPAGIGPQVRYQADATSQDGSVPNTGYHSGTPGVDDGTQTDVVSWAAPRVTFGALTAGVWSYNATTATAATDTLTLNFYNQLAQPVVTFTVTPGNTVATSTAVTVTAKEVDQFQNPIVGSFTGTTSGTGAVSGGVGIITAVRSGSNESSCVPSQSTANGGAADILVTNTSGVAGYTFSCDAPGVSTVSMVVTGPGGTQLASGKEAITFTGSAQHTTVERPTVNLTSFHKHHLTVNVHTSPSLGATRTVNVYRLRNGIKHLVGQTHTGPRGNASLSFSGLRQGATWRVAAKVVNLGTQYRSEFSRAVGHRIK